MGLTLAANEVPAGTLAGSPVEVIDTYVRGGNTQFSSALPIPRSALPGDVVQCLFGITAQGATGSPYSLNTTPSGLFVPGSGNFSFVGGGGHAQVGPFHHVVQEGDAGKSVALSFTGGPGLGVLGWGMIAYTLRNVDTSIIYDVSGTYATSGTTPSLNTATGQITSVTPGCLVVGFICAEGNTVGLGLDPGPIPAWYQDVSATGGIQNTVLVSGIVDLPLNSAYLGAGMQCNAGGTAVNTNWVGGLLCYRPIQAPGSAVYRTSPGGPSVDLASGRFLISWAYIPTNNRGRQQAWLLARQVHGTGAQGGYWNADDNVWSATEYWNAGPAPRYTVPAGAFVNDGTSWDLYGAISESAAGYHTPLTLIGTFTADPAPGLIVTGPVGKPTSPQPVLWTPILSAGHSEIAYKVRIFDHWQMVQPGWSALGLLDDTSSFPDALGLGNWAAYANCTIVQGGGQLGMGISCSSTGNCSALSAPTIANVTDLTDNLGSGIFSCTPGDSINATQRWVPGTTGRNVQTGLWFVDYLGNLIGSPTYGAAVSDAGGTTAAPVLSSATVTVPTGAIGFVLVSLVTGAATGEVHYVQESAAWSAAAGGAPRASSALVASAATTWTPSPVLRGGTYYSAFARIQQTGGQINPDWESVSWYAAYNNTAVPTVSVAPDVDPVTHTPRAKITVTGHDGAPLTGPTRVQDEYKSGLVAGANTLAFATPNGAGHLLVALVAWSNTVAGVSATITDDAGNVWARLPGASSDLNQNYNVDLYYCLSSVAFTSAGHGATVTATLPAGAPGFGGLYIAEIAPVAGYSWAVDLAAVIDTMTVSTGQTPSTGTAVWGEDYAVSYANPSGIPLSALPPGWSARTVDDPENVYVADFLGASGVVAPAWTWPATHGESLVATFKQINGPLAGHTFANVYRLDSLTNELTLCRFGEGVPIFWNADGSVQTATVYDYDMAPNSQTFYQGQVFSPSATGP